MYLGAILLLCVGCATAIDIPTLYRWKYMDFVWENESERQEAIANDRYAPSRTLPFDFHAHKDGRVFITTPRRLDLNPSSLSTVSNRMGDGGPLLMPYPSRDWQSDSDCSKINSIVKVTIDDCDRLWAVDTGLVANKQVCPHKILAFDLNTDELVANILIPDNVTIGNEVIEIQFVETADNCETISAYMSDMNGNAILVYQGSTTGGEIQRSESELLRPTHTDFTVGNESFYMDIDTGPGWMSVVSRNPEDGAVVLITTIGSRQPVFTTLNDLNNMQNGNLNLYASDYVNPYPVLSVDFSETGVGFTVYVTPMAIACWSIETPLHSDNIHIFESDPERLNMANSLKVLRNTDGEETLMILSNRLGEYIQGQVNPDVYNYHLIGATVGSIVEGTICEPSGRPLNVTMASLGFTLIPAEPPTGE